MPEEIDVILGVDEVESCDDDALCYLCQEKLGGEPGIMVHMPPLEPEDEEEMVFLACPDCADMFEMMATNHLYAIFKTMMTPPDEQEEGKVVQMPAAEEGSSEAETAPDGGEKEEPASEGGEDEEEAGEGESAQEAGEIDEEGAELAEKLREAAKNVENGEE